jgi:hypothetical protein
VKLVARVREGTRSFANSWDLWVFPPGKAADPARAAAAYAVYGEPRHTWLRALASRAMGADRLAAANPQPVVLSESLDGTLLKYVQNGGKVILCASEGLVRPFRPKFGFSEGHYYFTPPANYPPYEDGHDGTIIESHPMLGDFPHEGFADLQFFRMMDKAPPLELEALGMGRVDPVIRVMHSFPVARPLAYLAEAAVGRGGVILCALDLDQANPEARHLLGCLSAYAAGRLFAPRHALSEEVLGYILRVTAVP